LPLRILENKWFESVKQGSSEEAMKYGMISLSAMALAISAATAAAQAPTPVPSNPQVQPAPAGDRIQQLLTGITLTPEQRTKIDSLRAQATMAPADSANKDGNAAVEAEIRAVLTPDQQKQWDKNKDEAKKEKPMD